MADKKFSALKFHDEIEQDEVDGVLTALRLLMRKVSSPVVRACLEAARSDIAHLASTGDEDGDERLDDGADAAAAG